MSAVLRTERLELRPYQAADEADFRALQQAPGVRDRMGGAATEEELRGLFARLLPGADPQLCAWAAIELASGDYVGHVFLHGPPQCEPFPELGFQVHPSRAGCGLATEMAGAVLQEVEAQARVPLVRASVDEDHLASIRVLRKLGMQAAGYGHDAAGRYLCFEWSSPTRIRPPRSR